MTSEACTKDILAQLNPEFIEKGLALYLDADTARFTILWAKKYGLSLLALPPDFSILATITDPMKRLFFI